MIKRNRQSSIPKRNPWDNIFKQYIGNGNIKDIANNNTYADFVLLVALTGPVLRVIGRRGAGVIFHAPQQLPGDILGPLAASLWGPYENFRLPWHRGSRHVAMEQWLRQHAGGFLFVGYQDLQGSPHRAGEMLDMLSTFAAQGFKDGNRDESGPFIFIGETSRSPETLFSAAKLELDPTRIIVIPAGLASGYGPFTDLHNFPSARHLSDHLQQLLSPMSGAVISKYLTRLIREYQKNPTGLASRFQGCVDDYERLRRIEIHPSYQHVVSMFPVFYAVAMSAASWNVIRLSDQYILELVRACEHCCLRYYLDERGQRDLITLVSNYIINNLDDFIKIPCDDNSVLKEDFDNSILKTIPGCYSLDKEGNYDRFYIYPNTFRKAMAMAGVMASRVLRACDDADYMSRYIGSIEKKSQIRLGDDGRVQMYCFYEKILNHQPVDWFKNFGS